MINKLQKVEYLIIHHSERELDSPIFIKFRHIFIRGFDDVGYHYLIGNGKFGTIDGKLYKGRNENLEGAHALGYNKNSIGICIIGNLDKNKPTERQIQTLINFLKEKTIQYQIPKENILGHRETGSKKSCPGKNIDLKEIRKLIKN